MCLKGTPSAMGLDTTFDRLICVYLNTKSNVRVGYI